MSSPGPVWEAIGWLAYRFALIQPYIPTYTHLLVSALFPIFAGAHASLSRPNSAAKPVKKKEKKDADFNDEDATRSEEYQHMEGLSPSDALLYPLFTGAVLSGLYFLIKWLNDPAIINKIINWYLSLFGVLSIARLLSDSATTIISFVFPARYSSGGILWKIESKQRAVLPHNSLLLTTKPATPASPLPGSLGRLPLPPQVNSFLWNIRELASKPIIALEVYIHHVLEADIELGIQGISSLVAAIVAVLYFNLVDKPWWLTNLLGFSFCYSALQLMSPTTFWTGTLVLTSLFFYDIYFVFFTPFMITVATKLDVPVKLLFPRPPSADDDPSKRTMAMLGLGDVVLPGIMIGLALRFDLYMFYLKKQEKRQAERGTPLREGAGRAVGSENDKAEETKSVAVIEPIKPTETVPATEEFIEATYQVASGGWGERFWLNSGYRKSEGGSFPKTYFYASVVGYVTGLICTLGVMHVFKHGQPALLYLVPCVLLSLWGRALVKGEFKHMWEYTEEEAEEKPADKEDCKPEDATIPETGSDVEQEGSSQLDLKPEPGRSKKSKAARRLFCVSLSVPERTAGSQRSSTQHPLTLVEELKKASADGYGAEGLAGSPGGSSTPRRNFSATDGDRKRLRTD
jgi:minor histocompatibility antigen H13